MNDELLPNLVERLSDRNGQVRERARHTLVFIGSPAIPLLTELTNRKEKRPRWEAAKALADMVDPSCMPALIKLLSDSESDIRWIAAEGLSRLGPRSLPDVLRLLIERPKSIDTRDAVHHVLHKLAAENRVIQDLVAPVLDVLGETDPASSLPPRADQALKRIESLQLGEITEW